MPFAHLIARRPAARACLAAPIAAMLLVIIALAGPAAAVTGPTKLLSPAVSPRSGSTATTITFTVTYRNREGSAPATVRVVVGGTAHAMRPATSASDFKSGVRFRVALRLPAGTHKVTFSAADTRKFTDSIGGGSVSISGSTSGGGSTDDGGPSGSGGSGGSGGGSAGDGTSGSGAGTGSGAGGSPAAGAGGSASGSLGGGGVTSDPADATGSAAGRSRVGHPDGPPGFDEPAPAEFVAGTVGAPVTAEPDAVSSVQSSGGAGRVPGSILWPDSPGARLLDALGSTGVDPRERILVAFLSSTTASVAAMAFLFSKRRRDGEQPEPDAVLAASAAALAVAPAAGLVPDGSSGSDESALPRWRRPSLLAARKSDPLRMESEEIRLSFDSGVVTPVDGHERRRIRYRVVRLLDAPDELRSQEIGLLDQGDEVQLLQQSGSFWLVLCPDGSQGWLHRMTLGDVVETVSPKAGRTFPEATEEIDSDVLAAYLRVRNQP